MNQRKQIETRNELAKSEPKHTPEPWRIVKPEAPVGFQKEADRLIAGPEGEHIAESFQYQKDGRTDPGQAIANADRIVACVNGCQGINPEAVKDLLKALKELVLACKDDINFPSYDGYIRQAKAAIAKAEAK